MVSSQARIRVLIGPVPAALALWAAVSDLDMLTMRERTSAPPRGPILLPLRINVLRACDEEEIVGG